MERRTVRTARLLAFSAALIAVTVIATPAANATHSGYLLPSHNNYQVGGVTNWYNQTDSSYTLGIGSWPGTGRIALNASAIRTFSFDSDPALLALNPSGPGGDAIEASTSHANRSAIYAHHDGVAPNWGNGVYATSVAGDGVNASSVGLNKSGVWAHHEGSQSGYGVYAETYVGTGVSGRTFSAEGFGVVAENTAGGTALRVNGKTHLNGNVGVGISRPVSKLQVVGDYLQLPARTAAPPATDCDEAKEAGRVMVRAASTAPNLYVCRGTAGWRAI